MLGRWARAAVSFVKDVCVAVKDTVVKEAQKFKKACSKVMSAISGKKYFDEAEQRYEALVLKYDKAQRKYTSDVESMVSEIQSSLDQINFWKASVFKEKLPRFISTANLLHNVLVNGEHFEEFLSKDIFDINHSSGVRGKDLLFEINFNSMSFTQAALSILTLGFYSRKKAKQSLQQVIDEENRVDEEIQKFAAQLAKIEQVKSSINNVVDYFESLIKGYEKLLKRFEFGVNSQRFVQARSSSFDKLDFRLMPVKHIEEFHALFNLSVVMKTMSTMGYISETGDLEQHDLNVIKKLASSTDKLFAA